MQTENMYKATITNPQDVAKATDELMRLKRAIGFTIDKEYISEDQPGGSSWAQQMPNNKLVEILDSIARAANKTARNAPEALIDENTRNTLGQNFLTAALNQAVRFSVPSQSQGEGIRGPEGVEGGKADIDEADFRQRLSAAITAIKNNIEVSETPTPVASDTHIAGAEQGPAQGEGRA